MFTPSSDRFELEVLVAPETTLILLASILDPMRAANRVVAREHFRWTISTPSGAPAMTASGLEVAPARAFDAAEGPAALFVLASFNWRAHAPRRFLTTLGRADAARRWICGAESGAWMMAEAGLLNGRRATVHWEDLEDFAAAHAGVSVVDGRFVIDADPPENGRVTMGGASAAIDLMLELISAQLSFSVALEVARQLLYDQTRLNAGPQRTGEPARAPIQEPRVAAAVEVMTRNIETPLSIEAVAARAGVSPRRLQSLFLEELAVGPHAYYYALRLNAARRLLTETRAPVLEIAVRSGFGGASAFTRAYRGQFGESPSATRRRLRAARDGAPSP